MTKSYPRQLQRWAFALSLLAITLTSVGCSGGASSQAAAPPAPPRTLTTTPPLVEITFPTQGSTVGRFITVRGTAAAIPAGEELWLFVTAEDTAGYFPQNQAPILVFRDRNWNASAYIGQANGSSGKTFVLFPALIDHNDSEAHHAIQAYFQQTRGDGPISPLPSGIELLNPVEVIRA